MRRSNEDTKLIFENFRKFVSEAEGDDFLPDDDDMDVDIPQAMARPNNRSQAQHTAAAAAAATARDQQTAQVADRRAALASKKRAEMDAAFPEDSTGLDMPDQQTASPQQRIQRTYLNARRSGAGDESSGIARAMMDLQGDEEALTVFKSMISGDETTGYSFVRKPKPQDQSVAQPGRGTYKR
mgnify:CR=1 FL=1